MTDVSGDNPDNGSVRPAPIARAAAVASGITINALAILENDPIERSLKDRGRLDLGQRTRRAFAAVSTRRLARLMPDRRGRREP